MIKKVFNWFSGQSLTLRLSISILTCVFGGCIGMLFFLSQHTKPIVYANIENLAKQSLQTTVSTMAAIEGETQAAALTMKNTLKELTTSDVNMMRNILHSALQTLDYDKSDTSHAWIYVFPDGQVKSGTMYSAMIENNQFKFSVTQIDDFYKNFAWFKAVPKEEKTFWSEPYIDEESEKKPWVATCLIPFKFANSKEFNGLVAVSVDLTSLRQDISVSEFQGSGKFLLLSKKGLYVVHPDKSIQLKKTIFDLAKEYKLPQLEKAGSELQKGNSGRVTMPYSSVFRDAVIFFYAPIPRWEWGVCLVFSQKIFFEPVRNFQAKTLMAIMLGLIILFFVISFICHRSTKPLLDLSKIALQYGTGNFSSVLPASVANDEIGVLTSAFHNMRDNLLEHIEIVKHSAAEMQKSVSELEIARKIQQSALPDKFPLEKTFEVAALMVPARQVGGDFYDLFFIDKTHFAIVVADVSGKGIPAALYMMTTKALIKTITKTGSKPSDVLEKVNDELCNSNETNMFVTVFMAILNLQTGVLEYVNAGHNPPFYKTKNTYRELNVVPNIVLGGIAGVKYQSQSIKMNVGDRIFLYTDGVTEAQNAKGEFYGETRLDEILNQEIQSPEYVLNLVKNDVVKFADGNEQSDDITTLELLYCGNDDVKVYNADVSSINSALSYIEKNMHENKIPTKCQARIIVSAEEILSNIAQYAYTDKGRVRIKTTKDDNYYTVEFEDYGINYNPLKHPEPDLHELADDRKIGGLGTFLIKKMSNYVKYKRVDGKNILSIKVKLF